jgi:ABC-2 type transport system ATP-binding protein
MKQKLAVARAVLHRPDIVFLDEPTSGLDPVSTVGLREDLSALAAQEGVTVFLTTHNLAEAERLCSEVGVIRGGRLMAVGSPESLRGRRDTGRVEIITAGLRDDVIALLRAHPDVTSVAAEDGRLTLTLVAGAIVAPVVALLVHNGVGVEEVRKARATLEDAFLDLMGAETNGNGGDT